jgi:hypothetical protein
MVDVLAPRCDALRFPLTILDGVVAVAAVLDDTVRGRRLIPLGVLG